MRWTVWTRFIAAGICSVAVFGVANAGKLVAEAPVTVLDRDWVEEADFDADPTLYATELQTIVIDLEDHDNSRSRGRVQTNTVRFLVEESREFAFCIGENDAHLLRLHLKRAGSQGKQQGRRNLLKHSRGRDCPQVQLEPGRYELIIKHDSHSVPAGGKKAFLYDPESPALLGSDASSGIPAAMSFVASNGKFISGDSNANIVNANAAGVGRTEVWEVAQFQNASGYTLTQNNTGGRVQIDARVANLAPALGPVYLYTQKIGTNPQDAEFTIQQQSGWNFTMDAYVNSQSANGSSTTAKGAVFLDGSNQLTQAYGQVREPLQARQKIFDCSAGCGSSNLPLAAGEVALFSSCNYKGEGAAAITSIEQFVALDATTPGQTVRSIRLGPDTFVELFSDTGFGGDPQGFSEDQSCLSTPATVGSFNIVTSARTFVLDTDRCVNCTLDGIDFSGVNLDNGVFSHSSFANANLNGTSFASATLNAVALSGANMTGADFSQANLTGAVIDGGLMANAGLEGANLTSAIISITDADNLSATDFSGSVLHCASFRYSDISAAIFDVQADIKRDFTCYLNLSSTKFDYGKFDVTDWRYFDLSASDVSNVPDPLSTIDAPLDWSGIVLNNVQWLEGKQLDAINLGCYARQETQTTVCPDSIGTKACSTLQEVNLVKASLINACINTASMEGAFLTSANLDGANLSSALLKATESGSPATLQGAFMRNANISNADLTGVTANNVNFYTVSGGKADATGITATGADFSNSYMAFADFSGGDNASNLQSSNWTNTMLLGANFQNADLSKNTSGGVNSGTNTRFIGAYMHATQFDTQSVLTTVNFTNTYWDELGAGGKFNFLIPQQNLGFRGYWKDIDLPECPPDVMYTSGNPPPSGVTDAENTCPDGGPGPCDGKWGEAGQDISLAYFLSAIPPAFPPQPSSVPDEEKCSTNFSDPNPQDFCWITANSPSLCSENPQ